MMSEIVTSLIGPALIERILALLLDASIKGTLLLSLATVVSFTLWKSSAAARHRMWALTMLSLLALPLLPPVAPAVWSVTVPTPMAMFVPLSTVSTVPTPAPPMSSIAAMDKLRNSSLDDSPLRLSQDTKDHSDTAEFTLAASSVAGSAEILQPSTLSTLIPLAFFCGAILCLLHLAIGTWRVMQFRAAANRVVDGDLKLMLDDLRKRLRLNQSVDLRLHPEPVVPMTLGVFRPMIVLPRQSREWSEQLKRIVLLHELAHVKRRDIAFQWLGRLACSLYWFHPLAWWGLKQLRRERELACDDLVVHCGERATDYAEVLVSVAKNYQTQRGLACAVAMAQQGNLEGRMRSLFDKDIVRSHKPLSWMVAITMLITSVLTATAVSSMQLAAEPTEAGEKVPAVVAPGDEPDPQQPEGTVNELVRGITDTIKKEIGELVAGPGRYRTAGPLEQNIAIVDEGGKPVAGAKVIPWAVATTNGTGWGWVQSWPQDFTTNEDGIAKIWVSQEQTVLVPPESGDFTSMSFRVEHPGYAPAVRQSISRGPNLRVELKRGIRLSLQAIDSTTEQPITSDLYASSSSYPNPTWTIDAGRLQSTPFDPSGSDTGRYFRVVYAPGDQSESAALFSDIIDASELESSDEIVELDVAMHPCVSLSGTLSADVPRPVQPGGRVVAKILSGSNYRSQVWEDVAAIREDGTFVFPALPRKSHVELIAVCDGWVSKCSGNKLAEYDQAYGTNFSMLSHIMVRSTPIRLESDNAETTLDMIATSFCKFRVEDELGNPIDLATVHCWPNQHTRSGSTLLGEGPRTIDALRGAKAEPFGMYRIAMYSRVTNSKGITIIPNLPPGRQFFRVDFPGYAVIPDLQSAKLGDMITAKVEIEEGELAQKILRLRKVDDSSSLLNAVGMDKEGFTSWMIRIVDAEGVPLPQAKITQRSQSITSPGNQQPWPADWPTDVTTIGIVHVVRIRQPGEMTDEELRTASIWIDIEADGCVPLKNHEVSVGQRLPIRLQAAND